MRTDLNASALLYFLGDDVMEETQPGLMQEGDQQSPAGADSRQLQYELEEESYSSSYGGVNPSYRTGLTFRGGNSSYARVSEKKGPPPISSLSHPPLPKFGMSP